MKEFDITIKDLDAFNELIQGSECILSKHIVERLEQLQRKGLTRCKPEDFQMNILITDILQEIILTIDKDNLDEIIELNLRRLEEDEHYEYCDRMVKLKKRIESSRQRYNQKLVKELLHETSGS